MAKERPCFLWKLVMLFMLVLFIFCSFTFCDEEYPISKNMEDYSRELNIISTQDALSFLNALADVLEIVEKFENKMAGVVAKALRMGIKPHEKDLYKALQIVHNETSRRFERIERKIDDLGRLIELNFIKADLVENVEDKIFFSMILYNKTTNIDYDTTRYYNQYINMCDGLYTDPLAIIKFLHNRMVTRCPPPSAESMERYFKASLIFIELEKKINFNNELRMDIEKYTSLKIKFLLAIWNSRDHQQALKQIEKLKYEFDSLQDFAIFHYISPVLRKATKNFKNQNYCYLQAAYAGNHNDRLALTSFIKSVGLHLVNLRQLVVSCSNVTGKFLDVSESTKVIKKIAVSVNAFVNSTLELAWPMADVTAAIDVLPSGTIKDKDFNDTAKNVHASINNKGLEGYETGLNQKVLDATEWWNTNEKQIKEIMEQNPTPDDLKVLIDDIILVVGNFSQYFNFVAYHYSAEWLEDTKINVGLTFGDVENKLAFHYLPNYYGRYVPLRNHITKIYFFI